MSKTLEELGYEKEDILNIRREKIGIRFSDEDNAQIINIYYKDKTFDKHYARFTAEELKAIYKWCEDNKWI